jgi:hypothetical protein
MYRLLWARLGIFMLLFLSGSAPLHLAAEVHAMLPASAQHHAQIHCDPAEAGMQCNQPQDDIREPLNGADHERHHEVNCSNDGAFLWAHHQDAVSAIPAQWPTVTLEFAPFSFVWRAEFPVATQGSRGPPPTSELLPPTLSFPPFSGRAPPVQA